MRILFGGYSQIAAGTPHHVYERVLESVIKPILTYIYHSNDVGFSLALSGSEMEWLHIEKPELNMLISDLVHKGLVNMVGGAYWQGILSLLAPKDRAAQIEKGTSEIRRVYGERTNSYFCYGQVFSPYLLNTLSLCDMSRILIGPCGGSCMVGAEEPFVMRELDKEIVVLPISSMVSALTRKYGEGGMSFAVYLKELENLTNQEEQKDLVCFLNLDQLAQGGIQAQEVTQLCKLIFSRQCVPIDSFDDTKRIGYQCDGWYGDDCLHFASPCFNTLFLQDETLARIYGRYVVFSEIAKNYKKNREVKKQVEKCLLKASTGSPYIMDASASMVRQGPRQYVSKHINEAESLLAREPEFQFPEVFDYNRDGIPEYRCTSKVLKCFFSPQGGSVVELSYQVTDHNFAMAGLPLKDCGKVSTSFLHGHGIRLPLMTDVFLADGVSPTSLHLGEGNSDDLSRAMYQLDEEQSHKAEYLFTFKHGNLSISKHFKLRQNTLILEVVLQNTSTSRTEKGKYGVSCPLTVLPSKEEVFISVNEEPARRYRTSPEYEKVLEHVHSSRVSGMLTTTLFSPLSYTLVKERVFLRARTVAGLEDITLFHLMVPMWDYEIKPGESVKFNLGLRIEKNS